MAEQLGPDLERAEDGRIIGREHGGVRLGGRKARGQANALDVLGGHAELRRELLEAQPLPGPERQVCGEAGQSTGHATGTISGFGAAGS